MCQTIAQKLKGLEILTHPDVEHANLSKNFSVFWREIKSFQIYFNRRFVVLLDLMHPAKLNVSILVLLDIISGGEVGNRLVKDSQEFVAQTFVIVDLPVVLIEVATLVKNFDSSFVSAQEVQGVPKLF
jgi:hypothetical protein